MFRNFFQLLLVIKLSIIAKTLAFVSKITKKGSGTALPGLIVEKYFKFILAKISKQFDSVIMISGTNGKTTTRAVLVKILEDNDLDVCTNRGGANIYRGIASTLLLNVNLFGRVKSKIAVLEVEEATLPILTKHVKPNILILTNIFRDQLDAYGEIDNTLQYFEEALLQSNPIVYVNSDDNKLMSCLGKYSGKIIGFGLDIDTSKKPSFEKSAPISFDLSENYLGTSYKSDYPWQYFNIEDQLVSTKLPGVYNIYNILPAFLVAKTFVNPVDTIKSIKDFSSVFGRGEEFRIGDNNVSLFLVKNPAGFDLVLQHLSQRYSNDFNFVTLINDRIADGKDVSWLWDVDFESFLKNNKDSVSKVMTGGARGLDIALRLQYAGFDIVNKDSNTDNTDLLLDWMSSVSGQTVVLCTYTALMDLRKKISNIIELNDIDDSGN